MPFGVLARSDRTGRMVPQHRLFRSIFTNRQAEQEFMARCELSKRLAIDDELETSAVSGVRAYRDEFVTCSYSGARILKYEAGVSDYTKKLVRSDLLRTSEKSGRSGTVEEFGVCVETNMRLLLDELETTVSGLLVDSSRVFTCPVTSQKVLEGETEACEITGQRVAPGALRKCAITGQRVLPSELIRCAVTGDMIIASFAARSDYSGKTVRRDLLSTSSKPPGRSGTADEFTTCAVSGARLLRDEVEQCLLSQKWVNRDELINCDGWQVLKSMTGECQWSKRRILPKDQMHCKLTGLLVKRDYLDRNQMLHPLAQMLDGKLTSQRRADLLAPLRKFDPTRFGQAVQVWACEAPTGDRVAACIEVKEKKFLGLGRRTVYLGCVLRTDPVLSVIGMLVRGEREDGEWTKRGKLVSYS